MRRSTGRCAILSPTACSFREEAHDAQGAHRGRPDRLRFGSGAGLFYNSPMEACVIFCRTTKPPSRQGKILFINAVGDGAPAPSAFSVGNIDRIVGWYRGEYDDAPARAGQPRTDRGQRTQPRDPAVRKRWRCRRRSEAWSVDDAIAAWRSSSASVDAFSAAALTALKVTR